MPSKPPDAFLSYTRFDDQHDGGAITEFRKRLANAVRAVTGETFEIFQDVDGIGLGERWPDRLDEMLGEARFFIPILTPSYFRSKACRDELEKFLRAEEGAGRDDLVLPIYYIRSPVLDEDELRQADSLATIVYERQRWDWRDLRHYSFGTRKIRLEIEALAREIDRARRRPMPKAETAPADGAAEPNAISLDEFKARLPIAEVVGRHVRLSGRGRDLWGCCPFHNEKTASFHVVQDKGFYHCFGCGAHGNAIDFVMAVEGLDFGEALTRLAELTGLPPPRQDSSQTLPSVAREEAWFNFGRGAIFRDINAPWCPEMVVIAPGEFMMGSREDDPDATDYEKPQHLVRISYSLAVGRYPVTFEEYNSFAGDTSRTQPSDQGWGRGRRPVINVSWNDAKSYVEWLAFQSGWSGPRFDRTGGIA